MRASFIGILAVVTGCSSARTLPLEERWRPLEEIRQGSVPFVSNTAAVTLGTAVVVEDLDAFLAARPLGSPELEAVLAHELVHAQRQERDGAEAWLARYVVDRAFARDEELLGWRAQILAERRAGRARQPEAYALALARYRNAAGRLLSYEDALAFARAVLAEPL
jgi:hypothetical protein